MKPLSESTPKSKFNKKIAKEIAETSFTYVIDCILGYSDSGYTLGDTGESFEQNFEEDLQERGINRTEGRMKIIVEQYDKMRNKLINSLRTKFKYNGK